MNAIQQTKAIEDIIAYSCSDLRIILNVEQFMKCLREGFQIAVDFMCKNAKGMVDILFVDYDKISTEQFDVYSGLISKIWEVVELNSEPILKQIEIFWEVLFDLRWRAVVPDLQWGLANKLFQLIRQRDSRFVTDQFQRPNFLVSFLPLMKINSVAQIVIAFYEYGYNTQQTDFLKAGFERFQDFDPCSAINFTFIVHEIMTRILIEEQIDFIIQGDILTKMFRVIVREDLDAITLKNAAHVLSLISNFYSVDMQNIQLDDPETQQITTEFRNTEFFESFEIATISSIFRRQLQFRNKVGLLIIKLVEVRCLLIQIVDNLIRITDIKFWERIEKANIMPLIFELVHKFHQADIFISYVDNMLSFIFERALNDFHPYWTSQLIVKYKIHEKHLKSVDRQIYSFEQKLSLKLIQEGDFAPYFDYLKDIEESLDLSPAWRTIKLHLMKQEEIRRIKLGEDPGSPIIEQPIIISAANFEDQQYQDQDEITEKVENIFIMCQSEAPHKKNNNDEIIANIFETLPIHNDVESESKSESSSEQKSENSSGLRHNIWPQNSNPLIDELNKIEQMFDINHTPKPLSQSDSLDEHKSKQKRILSHSLNHLSDHDLNINMSSSLKHDHEQISPGLQRRSSLQTVQSVKKLNKNFEEFKIDFLNDRKILKKEDNSFLRVDEIDLEKDEKPQELLQVNFKKSSEDITCTSQIVQHQNLVNSVEEIKFKKLQEKDKHFLQFLKSLE